jgi:hypothetical protein
MSRAKGQWTAGGLAVAALWLGNCGGDNGIGPNARPTATPTVARTASPTVAPTATPTTAPTPSPGGCPFAPGPVARYAIAPRSQTRLSDGVEHPMKVHVVTPFVEETWCIDKDKNWRLEFNSNQRNVDGKECCWEGEPEWRIVTDTHAIVEGAGSWGGGFNYRLRALPGGNAGASFEIEAELDGIVSHPWQSGSHYTKRPLKIMAMSAANIAAKCQCIYRGNGIYEDNGKLKCPKIK